MIEATLNNPPKTINRREFLYYLLGASAAALAAGTCGAASWFTIPYLPEQRGLFIFRPSRFPFAATQPVLFVYDNQKIAPEISAKFWLSNSNAGLSALNQTCTFRGCLFKWQPNGAPGHEYPHFVCPCCGSQFTENGFFVTGPALRDLDQFVIEVTTPNGFRRTPADGGPVDIQGATQIVVDVEKKILGKPRPKPTATALYCDVAGCHAQSTKN
jgi:hypothetical protein